MRGFFHGGGFNGGHLIALTCIFNLADPALHFLELGFKALDLFPLAIDQLAHILNLLILMGECHFYLIYSLFSHEAVYNMSFKKEK